jgi:hypothetical protein
MTGRSTSRRGTMSLEWCRSRRCWRTRLEVSRGGRSRVRRRMESRCFDVQLSIGTEDTGESESVLRVTEGEATDELAPPLASSFSSAILASLVSLIAPRFLRSFKAVRQELCACVSLSLDNCEAELSKGNPPYFCSPCPSFRRFPLSTDNLLAARSLAA